MSPQTLERLRLKAELARSNLASGKEIDRSSAGALLQFQLERRRENVVDLKVRQAELLDRN